MSTWSRWNTSFQHCDIPIHFGMPVRRTKVGQAIVPQSWLPCSLCDQKERSDRSSTIKYLSFYENLVKIGLVDAEVIGL